MSAFTVPVTLVNLICPKCRGGYAISEEFRDESYRTGGFKMCWQCPYCGSQRGYGESEEDRLKKQITEAKTETLREKQRHSETECARLQAVVKAEKAEKRAKAALCPCCNRPFVALRRHLETKHPDFIGKKSNALQCKITRKVVGGYAQ